MSLSELKKELDNIEQEFSQNMLKLEGFEIGCTKPATMDDLYYLGGEMLGAFSSFKSAILDYLKDKEDL